jgi:protoheme IX farnesyltransferase
MPHAGTSMTPYLTLFRLPLSLFNAAAAATGSLALPHEDGPHALIAFLGVLFLSFGASGLNQYQERMIDDRMQRTRTRPLPSRTMTPASAMASSIIVVLAGSLVLTLGAGLVPLGLGLFALLWYNGMYTPLKRSTAFAAVPGALVGAIPPAIGWTAAGGVLTDPRLIVLCGFFFMWQVPHALLLHLRFESDVRAAGLPCLTDRLRPDQLSRLAFVWLAAVMTATFALPPAGLTSTSYLSLLLVPAVLGQAWNMRRLLVRRGHPSDSRMPFAAANIYLLIVMAVLSLDGIAAAVR